MATTTTQSTSKSQISPEQESHRLREAQELLVSLRSLLMEGEVPNVEILSNTLNKAEQLTLEAANNPDLDPQTSKALEDITALLVSARQLGRNKNIADRLQKISEETAKALKEIRIPGASKATLEGAKNFSMMMTNWRNLFYLLTSSRDFRYLLLDASRISRRVIYGYSADIREETKQKFVAGAPASEIASTVKDRVQQKGAPELSDEEWEGILDDIQRTLALLSKEPSYQEGMNQIFSLLDMFQRSLVEEPVPTALSPHNVHARRAVTETEDLVACFSGRESLDCFKHHLRNLMISTQKNEHLQCYLSELKDFILSSKSEQEVRTQEFKSRSKELAHRGRELMRELQNQEDLQPFFDSLDDMMENFKNDEFLQILRQHAGIVQSDLSYVDSQGKVVMDTDLLSKLQRALLPVLADSLKYIPIPKIHKIEKEREFWLDKIVLCSYDIIPDNIKFHLESHSEVSFRDVEVTGTQTHLVIQLDKLLTELKDMDFYYHKKTFPEFEDNGKVTFRIKGNGARLTFRYTILQGPEDKIPKIKEGDASFVISEMDIEFDKKTLDHPTLVPVLTSLSKSQIKNEIEREVEKNLNGFMKKLGDTITSSLQMVERPFLAGLDEAKKAFRSTQIAQVYEKRREKLE